MEKLALFIGVSLSIGGLISLWGFGFCQHFLSSLKQGVYEDFYFLFPQQNRLSLKNLSCSITTYPFSKKRLFLSIESLFLIIALGAWWADKSLLFALWLSLFFSFLWIVALLDQAYQLIPVSLCQMAWAWGILGIMNDLLTLELKTCIISSIFGAGIFLLTATLGKYFFKKEILGSGDWWLVFAFGAFLKVESLPLLFFIASLLGLGVAWWKKSKTIPFAPSLLLSFIVTLLDQFLLNVVIQPF